MAGKRKKRRKKKSQKDREILYGEKVINLDDKRAARRAERSRKAEARRKKRGVKSIEEQMLEQAELREHPEGTSREPAAAVKRPRRRKLTTGKLVIIVLIIVVLAVTVKSAGNIIKLKHEENAVKQEIVSLQAQKKDLQKQVNELDSSEYIEQQARNWLKMARQGDMVYIMNGNSIPQGSGITQEEEQADASKNQNEDDQNAL